jgi:REP element-mobilizing transposase RayT
MPNTYTQIYIQIVFTVKGRENLISKNNREELQKYITGIVEARNTKLISIYCMPDHMHILIGFKPTTLLSDLVRDVKAGSSKFINDKKWVLGKFNWQEGFGAFSYSHSQLDNVIGYINNQEEHHKKKTFKEEYLEFLEKFHVSYDDKYLFEWIEG